MNENAVFLILVSDQDSQMHGNDIRFFKYMNPESAISSLENGTMRWSCPRLFNDPFDFPVFMDFAFSGEDIAEALTEELVRMAYGPDEPVGDSDNQFIQLSLQNRKLKNRPSADEFKKFMSDAHADTIRRYEQGLIQRRAFLSEFRNQFAVFCVSAKKDNLLMWAHYAKDHTGAVIQFRCLPEQDRPLCAAVNVNYVESYPLLGNLQEYVKHLTGQSEIDYDNLFEIFAFTKSRHWAYEEEWRCVSKLQNLGAGFDYKPFLPDEFEAIYIGHRASPEHRGHIQDLVRRKYPNTKVFSTSVIIQDYSVAFHENR